MDRPYYIFCTYDKVEKTHLTRVFLDQSKRNAARAFIRGFDENNRVKYIPGLVGYDIMNMKEYELHCLGEFDPDTGISKAYDVPELVDLAQVIQKPVDTNGEALAD